MSQRPDDRNSFGDLAWGTVRLPDRDVDEGPAPRDDRSADRGQ